VSSLWARPWKARQVTSECAPSAVLRGGGCAQWRAATRPAVQARACSAPAARAPAIRASCSPFRPARLPASANQVVPPRPRQETAPARAARRGGWAAPRQGREGGGTLSFPVAGGGQAVPVAQRQGKRAVVRRWAAFVFGHHILLQQRKGEPCSVWRSESVQQASSMEGREMDTGTVHAGRKVLEKARTVSRTGENQYRSSVRPPARASWTASVHARCR